MCKPYPGPRCFDSLKKDYQASVVAYNKVLSEVRALEETVAADSDDVEAAESLLDKNSELVELEERREKARLDLNSAPSVYRKLFDKAKELKKQGNVEEAAYYEKLAKDGKKKYDQADRDLEAENLLKAVQNPDEVANDFYSEVPVAQPILSIAAEKYGLDQAQMDSILVKTLSRRPQRVKDLGDDEWDNYVTQQKNNILFLSKTDDEKIVSMYRQFSAYGLDDKPSSKNFHVIKEMDERASKAHNAIRRQVDHAAALQGVDYREAAEKFDAYRAQYLNDYAHLEEDQRPQPPSDWVRGYLTKDTMSMSSPADKATLYAMYRCQADPNAFPSREMRYASVDIETTGPEGKEGLKPENGGIIEVGIVTYDGDGNEVNTYSTMVNPGDDMINQYGTGAVDVHGIKVEDLDGAPSWADVAPKVEENFEGSVLIIQNANYERSWFSEHMPKVGSNYNYFHQHIDTMRVAQQHQPHLEKFKLSYICEANGVAYTNGHRAEHDAHVAADAFFVMRSKIRKQYSEDPVFSSLPQPAPVTKLSNVFRFSPGEMFTDDPWSSQLQTR